MFGFLGAILNGISVRGQNIFSFMCSTKIIPCHLMNWVWTALPKHGKLIFGGTAVPAALQTRSCAKICAGFLTSAHTNVFLIEQISYPKRGKNLGQTDEMLAKHDKYGVSYIQLIFSENRFSFSGYNCSSLYITRSIILFFFFLSVFPHCRKI